MRKLAIILTFLLGLAIGYLAGCRGHGQARTVQHEPHAGERWHDQDGRLRIVRAVTREGQAVRVWWYRHGACGADHHCTVGTWRAWARNKGARPEP